MADNTLKVLLSGDSKELDAALSRADKKLKEFGDRAKEIGKSLSVSLTAPLAIAGGAAIKMASDYEESLNKVSVAFKGSSNDVKAFAKTTLTSFGIAEGTALDMAALFGDMATSMGLSTKEAAVMSKSLVGLAGDMASFKNMNIEEVTTALNGVFTGETESLKRLGIVMTEANVKAFALSKGITAKYEAMSQGEKVMLRYQYVMSSTTNAQGDFARTSDGAANQMRIFQETMKELGVTFGQVVLPAVTKVIHALNGMLSYLKELPAATKLFITGAAGIAALAGPFLYLAGTVIPKVITGVKLLRIAFANLGTTIKAAGIIGLISAMAGAALEQQSALSGANDALAKLSDEEKTNANAIRSKNKELYASITAYEVLRKSAAQQDAIYKAQTNQDRNTAKTYEDKIAAAKAFIVANRQLLKTTTATAGIDPTGGGVDLMPKGDGGNGDAIKEQYGLAASIQSLAEKVADARKETLALKNEFLELRWPSLGDPLKALGYDVAEVTEKIKTPFQIMNESIQESSRIIAEDLALKQQEFDLIMVKGQTMAEAVSGAFGVLGQSIMQSMGEATTGLGRFLQGMAQTTLQLAQYVIKEIIMQKALAMATATANATKSASATGPAAVFTQPAFMAMAIGGVLSSFASIPKFAAGGIVSGPTMGIMGEYAGARSNPEVIAPLNKLQGMLDTGGGGGAFTLETKVSGQDLLLVLQRAEKQNKRLG
jgi:hypothetical protein